MICRLQQETGITTLFVTHDQAEAVAVADRIALMFAGQLKQVDSSRNLFEQPEDTDVARFFGGVNFLPVQKEGDLLHTQLGSLQIKSSQPDGQAIATVRPEAIELGPNGHNNLKAYVKSYSYQGSMARCLTDLGGVELQIVAPPYRAVQPGQEIIIHIPRDRIWLLPISKSSN